jgi:biotin carboxyl carrier protein
MHDESEYTGFVLDDSTYETTLTTKFKERKPFTQPDPKKVLCVIPGIIYEVNVHKGQKIKTGNKLFVLEAMKMQNEIMSHTAGIIKEIHISKGQMVTKGQVLVEFE